MASFLGDEIPIEWAVLVSLLLQSLLLVLATFRKRTSNSFMGYLVFVIYFLSTKVAAATFVLIAGVKYFTMSKMPFGLWAAIMLLHSSGQDRLNAYSLEDNESWRTSTLNIVWQMSVHFGIISLQNDLAHIPTWIMFCLAVYKMVLRVCRYRFGTKEMMLFGSFLSDDFNIMSRKMIPVADDDSRTVYQAHCFLKTSLHLFAESKYFIRQQVVADQVREFFRNMTDYNYGIKLIEIELNFMYESFHTDGTIRKHLNHHWSIRYALLRCVEPMACVIAALIFYLVDSPKRLQSGHMSRSDYILTNLLLFGTCVLELVSCVMVIFSDWTIAATSVSHSPFSKALIKYSPQRQRWWSETNYQIYINAPITVRFARNLCRRWSETISKFNILNYSIKTRARPYGLQWEALPYKMDLDNILDTFTGTQNLYTRFRYVSGDWYTEGLGRYVFKQLQEKEQGIIKSLETKFWSKDEYLKSSVLVWHIVTEILFRSSDDSDRGYTHGKYSVFLSDYMAYLLFMKPHFMAKSRLPNNPLETGELTAARRKIQEVALEWEGNDFQVILHRCCEKLLNRSSENIDREILSSVNYEGNELIERHIISEANELIKRHFGDKQKLWGEISKMWVDILLYAASKYDQTEHVKGLCEGGELITIVWLLAFHLGLLPQD